MNFNVRRVVTGHDRNGKAIVQIDELANNVTSVRKGAASAVLWSTDGYPIDNADNVDGSKRELGTSLPQGTVFRVVRYEPGVTPRNHRTNSIDYAVILSGEIDMELDDSVVHLKAGDLLVQRGTIHNWVNKGTEPCVIAFVLVGAKAVSVSGKLLHEVG
jgi:quercetin dioxygenase-like cupin family protein